ncbi:hypothetical protein D3C86_1724930 [compost metagenome]
MFLSRQKCILRPHQARSDEQRVKNLFIDYDQPKPMNGIGEEFVKSLRIVGSNGDHGLVDPRFDMLVSLLQFGNNPVDLTAYLRIAELADMRNLHAPSH